MLHTGTCATGTGDLFDIAMCARVWFCVLVAIAQCKRSAKTDLNILESLPTIFSKTWLANICIAVIGATIPLCCGGVITM